MVRLLAGIATLVLATSFATADDRNPRSAGSKGTVTAWDESATLVLEHRFCVRSGRYGWNYVSCGARLRDDVKRQLCARGPGMHRYLYQIGDGRPTASTVHCRKP